ncbi:MAG: ABC transporter permease [Oscillatoriales cyanobacterium SM2_2_1]|nr:ABC transporter permease [Oscillatoriales cyanobacterium SM2_2_1]
MALGQPTSANAPSSTPWLKWLEPLVLLGPGAVWLGVFLILPTSLIFVESLKIPGQEAWSFGNYQRVFENIGGTFIYLTVVWRSLLFAVATTTGCLVLGFPVAYWFALMAPKRWRNLLLLLFILPLWTSSLLRSYSWITILRPTGVMNGFLNFFGLPGVNLLNKAEGVIIGMVYAFLPYMVLILYTSLEKLDVRLLEAAEDLGATALQTFWRVTVPQVKPGIVAGSALVGITSFGDFINPEVLGGPASRTISYLIELQFLGASRNWGFGSALSLVLILGVTGVIVLLLKYGDRSVIADG